MRRALILLLALHLANSPIFGQGSEDLLAARIHLDNPQTDTIRIKSIRLVGQSTNPDFPLGTMVLAAKCLAVAPEQAQRFNKGTVEFKTLKFTTKKDAPLELAPGGEVTLEVRLTLQPGRMYEGQGFTLQAPSLDTEGAEADWAENHVHFETTTITLSTKAERILPAEKPELVGPGQDLSLALYAADLDGNPRPREGPDPVLEISYDNGEKTLLSPEQDGSSRYIYTFQTPADFETLRLRVNREGEDIWDTTYVRVQEEILTYSGALTHAEVEKIGKTQKRILWQDLELTAIDDCAILLEATIPPDVEGRDRRDGIFLATGPRVEGALPEGYYLGFSTTKKGRLELCKQVGGENIRIVREPFDRHFASQIRLRAVRAPGGEWSLYAAYGGQESPLIPAGTEGLAPTPGEKIYGIGIVRFDQKGSLSTDPLHEIIPSLRVARPLHRIKGHHCLKREMEFYFHHPMSAFSPPPLQGVLTMEGEPVQVEEVTFAGDTLRLLLTHRAEVGRYRLHHVWSKPYALEVDYPFDVLPLTAKDTTDLVQISHFYLSTAPGGEAIGLRSLVNREVKLDGWLLEINDRIIPLDKARIPPVGDLLVIPRSSEYEGEGVFKQARRFYLEGNFSILLRDSSGRLLSYVSTDGLLDTSSERVGYEAGAGEERFSPTARWRPKSRPEAVQPQEVRLIRAYGGRPNQLSLHFNSPMDTALATTMRSIWIDGEEIPLTRADFSPDCREVLVTLSKDAKWNGKLHVSWLNLDGVATQGESVLLHHLERFCPQALFLNEMQLDEGINDRFLEVYNPSELAVDLSEYNLGVGGKTSYPLLEAFTILRAGRYAVLLPSTTFRNWPEEMDSALVLHSEAIDRLHRKRPTLELIHAPSGDTVFRMDLALHLSREENPLPKGNPFERFCGVPTGRGDLWGAALLPDGTPGRRNSICEMLPYEEEDGKLWIRHEARRSSSPRHIFTVFVPRAGLITMGVASSSGRILTLKRVDSPRAGGISFEIPQALGYLHLYVAFARVIYNDGQEEKAWINFLEQ